MLKLQDRPVTARYARALFQAARAGGLGARAREDLRRLSEVMKSVPAAAAVVRHPGLDPAAKTRLLHEALGLSPAVQGFLRLLFEKKRWDVLTLAAGAYERLADEADGVLSLRLITAAPVGEGEAARLGKRLSAVRGGPVRVEAVVDETLIGGAVLRAGDRVWDSSLKGQLGRLREALRGAGGALR